MCTMTQDVSEFWQGEFLEDFGAARLRPNIMRFSEIIGSGNLCMYCQIPFAVEVLLLLYLFKGSLY